MDRKCYCLGLSGESKLVCEVNGIFHYTTKENNNRKVLVTGKKSDNSMTVWKIV